MQQVKEQGPCPNDNVALEQLTHEASQLEASTFIFASKATGDSSIEAQYLAKLPDDMCVSSQISLQQRATSSIDKSATLKIAFKSGATCRARNSSNDKVELIMLCDDLSSLPPFSCQSKRTCSSNSENTNISQSNEATFANEPNENNAYFALIANKLELSMQPMISHQTCKAHSENSDTASCMLVHDRNVCSIAGTCKSENAETYRVVLSESDNMSTLRSMHIHSLATRVDLHTMPILNALTLFMTQLIIIICQHRFKAIKLAIKTRLKTDRICMTTLLLIVCRQIKAVEVAIKTTVISEQFSFKVLEMIIMTCQRTVNISRTQLHSKG